MRKNQFALLKDKRFLPLFITQFLGAFHDNLFKNALVVLIIYGLASTQPENPELLVTLAAGIFILPFVLFSAIGGQLADKYPKEMVIQKVKLAEIGIALFGMAALLSGSILLSFLVLFALGTQSAFFGPSKYSILPQHLAADELIGGNALLNTGSFLAILCGTIAGTVLIAISGGQSIVGSMLIGVSVTGYLASRFIPSAPPKAQHLKMDLNPFRETIDIIRYIFSHRRGVILSLLGVGWFYFLGGMFLAQMPNYTQSTLGANEHVLALFLVLFSIGIGVGGLFNNRLLKGKITAKYVPAACLGITLFSVDLFFASRGTILSDTLTGLKDFISTWSHWRIIVDLVMVAICGGLFVVPLNAIIQHKTEEDHRARVIAGSAIVNALFVVASSLFSAILIGAGWSIPAVFLAFAVLNTGVAVFIRQLPRITA